MSTTLDEDVAKFYAAGGSSDKTKAGILFEVQMGMIDRGASMGWLSQYPHEQEITFAPLTGLEVVSTTVDHSVLVVQVRLNINLQALTIEEVVSKRHKLVRSIAENMVTNFRPDQDEQWKPLLEVDAGAADEARSELLRAAAAVTELPAHSFNDDEAFGQRVNAIISARAAVEWCAGLKAILDTTGVADVAELVASGTTPFTPLFRASATGLGDELMNVVTIFHRHGYLRDTVEIDITQNQIGPSSTKRWAELLQRHDLPKLEILGNWGNALGDDGITHISAAMRCGKLPGLRQMRCGANEIGDPGFAHLMETLASGVNPHITVLGFYDNHILSDGAVVAMAAAARAGMLRKLEKTDLSTNSFGDEGMLALCAAEKEAAGFPNLLELRIAFNKITDVGAHALADVFAAGGFPSLVLVDFTMNSLVTDAGKQAIKDACNGRPFVPSV